ncbi:serine hydrolase domain-containing protein [Allomuricauda sp. d1]|uniref:serine hydrolase domain-containing protein n=1 Tax=Allomuricauda sp. d1 TaxID=3136725 RepID=UPI0031D21E6A
MKRMKVYIHALLICAGLSSFSQGVSKSILEEIKHRSEQSHSDALIIIKDGKVIHENYFGKAEKPIYIASAGKSLTSLAIGKLIDKKLLDSLDQPIYTIYPEWKQGRKKDVTVRMLMNHTSGIQNNLNASIELEPAPDYKVDNIVKLALAAELTDDPGSSIIYNNKAVALLGGIVKKLSGSNFDDFFAKEFFEPMNIVDYEWIKDKSGNPTVHGAFVIKASDLAKFGILILNDGVYKNARIISEEWIDESLKQSQEFTPIWGLLWWRLPEYEKRIIDDSIWSSWKEAVVDGAFLDKMLPIKDKVFDSKDQFYAAMEHILGEQWPEALNRELPKSIKLSRRIYGEKIMAYYADGYRGNYLVIIPETKIIAVRCADSQGFDYKTDFFPEFVSLVSKL